MHHFVRCKWSLLVGQHVSSKGPSFPRCTSPATLLTLKNIWDPGYTGPNKTKFFLPVQPVYVEPCNFFTDSSIVCRSKTSTVLWVLASFCPFKNLFGPVKMGSEATCSLVILYFFYFSLLRDLLKKKPFSTSIKKWWLFSGEIFNTIIWNIKKCSTNRRFNIFVSEAEGNEADIFSPNKTSCEFTPISHKFSVTTTKFSCRCRIWQRRRWRWRNGRSNLLSGGVTGLHRNRRADHLLSWGQSLLFLFHHWVYKRVDKPLRRTHSLSIRLFSHYSYSKFFFSSGAWKGYPV